jgi:hypothetical protein
MDRGKYIEACNTSREKVPPDPGFINTAISCIGADLAYSYLASQASWATLESEVSLVSTYPLLVLSVSWSSVFAEKHTYLIAPLAGRYSRVYAGSSGASSVSNLVLKSGVEWARSVERVIRVVFFNTIVEDSERGNSRVTIWSGANDVVEYSKGWWQKVSHKISMHEFFLQAVLFKSCFELYRYSTGII